jgi:DNA sulfur modification protein DndC
LNRHNLQKWVSFQSASTGKHHFAALIDFRLWLKDIRNDPRYRSVERRNGEIRFNPRGEQIQHVPGPFTIQARKMIFDKLLETQAAYGDTLISDDEIERIHAIWADEISRPATKRGEKNE